VRGADDEQQHLFCRYIAPVCDEFCERLSESSGAGIYRELGHLFAAFCAVERQAFEIER
jgi:TorA maturation chaperone TorD